MDLSFPFNNINRSSVLPPMAVKNSVKNSDKWQKAVMDSFEFIGVEQLYENLQFLDYYRMIKGEMSYQELKDVVPYLDKIEDLVKTDLKIPSFLKHYDLLGMIARELVGRYIEFQDKYHIKESGEIANNEFLRFKDEEIHKVLSEVIETSVNIGLAELGIDPNGQQFESPEQQQQFLAELKQKQAELTPKETKKSTTTPFKTIGAQWAEATLEQDKERFNFLAMEQASFKDYFLTGRWFRHEKIGFDSYKPENWDVLTAFWSKEVGSQYPQKGEYVGRVYPATPAEVIKQHGHNIPGDIQKELLGGNNDWKDFINTDSLFSGSIEKAINSNFTTIVQTPNKGYLEYNNYLKLQDYLQVPLGQRTSLKDGQENVTDRWLPDFIGNYNNPVGSNLSSLYRTDFVHRTDECILTEVYFKAMEMFGYLSYRDPETGRMIVEEVTEDIHPDFLKENNIKTTFKETYPNIIKDFPENTIQWTWKPVVFEGLKIQSGNLSKPYIAYCRKCDNQIKGDHLLDVQLPVSGFIGESEAKKIMPYQIGFNVAMNQAMNLAEKEIGMFLLFDVAAIPSDIPGFGKAKEALMHMREMAKDIGMLPAKPTPNGTNIFEIHDLSATNSMLGKFNVAEYYKRGAFEAIGSNPVNSQQPAKYTTAEGVQVSNEARYTQVSSLYEIFGASNKESLELHLAVAQYCQSNKKDITISYTKSDSSVAFLQFTDPKLSLRDIGLMPSNDPKARKDFESYRQYLITTNTITSDPVEVAKLFASKTMQNAIDIAVRERDARQELEQIKHERDMELVELKAKQDQDKSDRELMNKIKILEKEIQGDIYVAQITAQGRAADKNTDTEGVDAINSAAELNLKKIEIDNDFQLAQRESERIEKLDGKSMELEMEKLALKAQELRNKLEMKKIDQNIAYANKN